MTILDPRTEETLRHGFSRYLNPFMVTLWRLGLGHWFEVWPEVSGRIMVIRHTGRKTGKRQLTPVNYAMVEGELYAVAGFGPISDWYRNLMANPQVEVWLPDGWWSATVEDISDSERRLQLLREVIIGSGFVAYLFRLNPHTCSDSFLEKVCTKYRLLHIRRNAALTGRGGPGELAWVWPLATMILLPLALMRRRQRGK
jgi:deazaflavin-dependent oxidoreductase (nitroreductase family)